MKSKQIDVTRSNPSKIVFLLKKSTQPTAIIEYPTVSSSFPINLIIHYRSNLVYTLHYWLLCVNLPNNRYVKTTITENFNTNTIFCELKLNLYEIDRAQFICRRNEYKQTIKYEKKWKSVFDIDFITLLILYKLQKSLQKGQL